jgi:3'-phosphoadenosine 5'-phosphosulfate sulfotransferase (PAPS reductase)/FAD synthetase
VSIDGEWLRRWIEYFLTWYDEGRVEEKANEAKEFVAKFLDEGIVSVSGGKDSMALLHIVASAKPDITVFHWNHGATLMPREIEEEILNNIKSVAPKARLIVKKYSLGDSEKARVDWRPWYREFFAALRSLGYRYHILGIRADESCRRASRGRIVARRHWVEVHPIYFFTWRDVWAYIFKHRVPVPRMYFVYAKLLGWDKARLVTFFDKEFEKYGAPTIDSILMWRYRHLTRQQTTR